MKNLKLIPQEEIKNTIGGNYPLPAGVVLTIVQLVNTKKEIEDIACNLFGICND